MLIFRYLDSSNNSEWTGFFSLALFRHLQKKKSLSVQAEKIELRDEKQRLKEEKENLEQQVKTLASKPGFLSHPSAMGAAFTAQGQVAGNKLMPFIGYPSVAMWQFMQPAVVDTSQDHVLRPPVA